MQPLWKVPQDILETLVLITKKIIIFYSLLALYISNKLSNYGDWASDRSRFLFAPVPHAYIYPFKVSAREYFSPQAILKVWIWSGNSTNLGNYYIILN